MRAKNLQLFSRYTNKGPSIAERIIRTLRILIMKPVFEKVNADWLCELSAVFNEYNDTIQHSIKMTRVQASRKSKKIVYSNLKENRDVRKTKFHLGQIVRTAGIKKVFSEGDSTNFSYKLYTETEVIHDTIPSYRINYLTEKYNENFFTY